MNEIKHNHTKEVTCPYCGYEFSDSWEFVSSHEDLGLIDCPECDKEFYGTRNIEVTYSTKQARYGTCKHCNRHNLVIENYYSNCGGYEDYCITCGSIERKRLMTDYFEMLEGMENSHEND